VTQFTRIFRALVDTLPSSGAGPVAQPDQLDSQVSPVILLPGQLDRLQAAFPFTRQSAPSAAGAVQISDTDIVPDKEVWYLPFINGFHNGAVSHPMLLSAVQPNSGLGTTFEATWLLAGGADLPSGRPICAKRPILLPPGWVMRVTSLGVGADVQQVTIGVTIVRLFLQEAPPPF